MGGKRKSGVLLHISSLPGEYSIGSLGGEAREFVDFLAAAGFGIWQILPLSRTDGYFSPYKSVSSFGANPFLIDLFTLYEKGLLTSEELYSARQKTPYLCEFERLFAEREELLYRAAMRIGDRSKILEFVKSIPPLWRSASFLAEKKDGATPDTLFFYAFVEYEFYTEWQRLHEYAASRGIEIIGDLPMYVDEGGCEVWADPEQFKLDKGGRPTERAGVPPDYFSPDGQLWGNPLYDWDKMRENGFSWWRERLEFALSLFDGVRIDHFRAFEAYWSVPDGAKSAREGRWIKGPGKPLVDALLEVAGGRLVIAEDLGDITDGVRALLDYSGLPGMRVFQFGFLGGENSLHLPYNYPKNSVAYTGTHDNNTTLGYLFELDEGARARVLEYCGAVGSSWSDATRAAVRAVMASHSDTAIIPIQDLLAYGADTRMNTPGTAHGNWAYRITRDDLRSLDAERLRRMNILFGRCGK